MFAQENRAGHKTGRDRKTGATKYEKLLLQFRNYH
jgi:hypothetical protein